jgi:hypothetical protein
MISHSFGDIPMRKRQFRYDFKTYEEANSLLGEDYSLSVATNISLIRHYNTDSIIYVRLYNTYIITYFANGVYEFNHGGFYTKTTKQILERFSPFLFVPNRDHWRILDPTKEKKDSERISTTRFENGLQLMPTAFQASMFLPTPKSSSIRTLAYDKEKHSLHIQFNSYKTYWYFEVPKKIVQRLFLAESKGSFIHQYIKSRERDFPYRLMTERNFL